MAEFVPGLIQGGEALSRDRYREAQIKETQDIADIRRQLFGEKQQEKQEDALVNNYLMRLMRTLGQPGQDQAQPLPVQAPPPGQASQPAPPPMAPPTQGPPPMAPPGGPGGQMNPMLLASMQRPQIPPMMAGGGGAPPMAGPAPGGPPAGPASQGPPPVGPQGPPAPVMPPAQQGWQAGGTADAKLGGGLTSAGMAGPGIMPRQAPSVAQITAEMDKMNIPPNMQYKVLAKAYPMIEAQNKEAMDRLKAQAQIWEAGAKAMEAQRKMQEFEKYGTEPTPEIKNALFATGGRVNDARLLVAAEEEGKIKAKGEGEKAPSGYRWSKGNKGELEAIPGGPADPSVVAAKKNAIQITGGRESVYTNRVMQAADQASRDLANIVKIPLAAQTTGIFGGRHQGAGLFDAGKEVLAQKMTPQEAQTYNVMATGLQRTLAAVETSGLAQGIQEFSKQIDVVAKEGETNLTKLHKLAQIRQIIEAGMDPILVNPRVTEEQKGLVYKMLDKVHAAVPFTHSDLIELTAKQEINPKTTLKQVLKKSEGVREFATEEEAAGAGLKPGTKVKIGGQLGTWTQ